MRDANAVWKFRRAVTAATGSQRAGMATVLFFLGAGAAILATVRPVRREATLRPIAAGRAEAPERDPA